MCRRAYATMGGLVLLAAWVVGLADGPGLPHVARAEMLSVDEADRLTRDLDGVDQPLLAFGEGLAKVARLTADSVVHIETRRSGQGTLAETGSGVLMNLSDSADAFVVTNRHVVSGSGTLTDISVRLADGRFLHPLRVWQDPATDIAVLRLPDGRYQVGRWGDSDAVQRGHFVMALGSPFGLSQSVSLGIVSAKGRRSLEIGNGSEMLNQDFLQTDAAVNPGNSGGPLVDLRGRVVGINTAIASNSGGNEGIAFSIPSNLVRRVAEALVTEGRVARAYLGVKLDPAFDAAAAARYRLERLRGARVLQVYADTPAAFARMQRDDIILAIDGAEVLDENHLINLVSLTPIGSRVGLTVLRGGRTLLVEVLLADRTELGGHEATPARPPSPPRFSPSSRIRPSSFVSAAPTGKPTGNTAPRLHPLTADLARQLGVAVGTTGLVVLEPPVGGPLADRLQIYDLVTEAARVPITTTAEFAAVRAAHRGHPVVVRVVRPAGTGEPRERLILWPND